MAQKTTTKPKRGRPAKVDTAKVKELAEKGVSSTDIAKTQGCSRQYVEEVLKRYNVEKAEVDDFRNVQGDLLAHLQMSSTQKQIEILNSMPNSEIKKMTNNEKRALLHTLATTSGIHFDKLALLEGRATQNIQSLLVHAQADASAHHRSQLMRGREKADPEG
jgi:hypothetical protein